MKPISTHWADIAASKLVSTWGDKPQYTVASGITPSGMVHVGNFREVITVDLVARSLKALGKKVRFIYSWDNFDTFRKVPKNVPDPDAFTPYLFRPIARIPDPWGKASSYASGRMELFEAELDGVGIYPEYLKQEERYSSGLYAAEIRKALEQKDKIIQILNAHRTSPLEEGWLPTSIYCDKCEKDDMRSEKYSGEWDYSYECGNCGHKATVDIRKTKNLKLAWRIDWPMRWFYEQVDFEPGGKDHSSQGGSFDTGKEISKQVWGRDPPMYLQYDFVMIKGGTGKMSSSSGELYTLNQVLEIYEPQIVRWIFANQKPNHDFSLALDEDVIKIYDEFDRFEAQVYEMKDKATTELDSKQLIFRRVYELSQCTEGDIFAHPKPHRASFRVLCNRLQICSGDFDRTLERYYLGEITSQQDRKDFNERAKRAWHWLENYAPEEFRYHIFSEPSKKDLQPKEKEILQAFRKLLETVDLEQISPKDLNELLWEHLIKGCEAEAKDVFSLVYQRIIGRDQGPRLPSFLKEIGKEKLLELI